MRPRKIKYILLWPGQLQFTTIRFTEVLIIDTFSDKQPMEQLAKDLLESHTDPLRDEIFHILASEYSIV